MFVFWLALFIVLVCVILIGVAGGNVITDESAKRFIYIFSGFAIPISLVTMYVTHYQSKRRGRF